MVSGLLRRLQAGALPGHCADLVWIDMQAHMSLVHSCPLTLVFRPARHAARPCSGRLAAVAAPEKADSRFTSVEQVSRRR